LAAAGLSRSFSWATGRKAPRVIDPQQGAPQANINYEYKEALARATVRERAERIISRIVVGGIDVTEEQAAMIYERELKKLSRKFTHMRYHSFLMYFGVLKRLGWVEATSETEASSIQENYPPAPERTFYRLTRKGIEDGDGFRSNPLLKLYPEVGPSHMKRSD
jgi:hypothetical protein